MFNVHKLTFNPLEENTYVLIGERGEGIVIDPGCYGADEQEALAGFFTQNGVQPKLLLQTHTHLDHVFGTKWVAETYGLIPHIHRDEDKMMDLSPAFGLEWGLPFDGFQGHRAYLERGGKVSFGDNILEILLVPGHSPGHLCFYCPAQGFLIGGDVLFRESIGRTDLPGGDHPTLIRGIKEQLFTLPEETIVYPGHGPETTIGHEKRNNPFI
jgi:glyoxylase-like metal-dependent hydrolase (beta-lactamase superfamily II)